MRLLISALATVLCFLSTLHVASAQETTATPGDEVYETIYLKSGTKIVGRVVQWDPDPESIFIFETTDGRQFRVYSKTVRRVRSNNSLALQKHYRFKEQGIYQRTTLGVSAGPEVGQTLTHSIGYRWNRKLGVGVGAGYANYRNGQGQRLIPVFAEIHGFLQEKNVSPYYSFRAGYAWADGREDYGWSDQSRGGAFVKPELGYRLGASDAVNFMIGVGVKLQKANFVKEDDVKIWYDEDYTVKRYELSLALVF